MIDWGFLKQVDLQDIQQNLWRCREVQTLPGNHDEQIDAHGDPDLRLDGVD